LKKISIKPLLFCWRRSRPWFRRH